MKRKLLITAGMVALLLATQAQAAESFYARMLERGRADALAGDYTRAIPELQAAAFGSVDSIPAYQTAQAYLAFALVEAGRPDEALASARKIAQAERLQPSLSTLTLEPTVRSAAQHLLATLGGPEHSLMSSAAIDKAHAAPPGAQSAQPQVRQPQPAPPQPAATRMSDAERPATSVSSRIDTPAPLPPPAPLHAVPSPEPTHDVTATRAGSRPMGTTAAAHGAEALARYRAGDVGGALALADATIAEDMSNGPAHEVMGLMAAEASHWSEVVSHFSTARTRQRLTDDEAGLLLLGYVYSGRMADAAGMRRILPAGALRSSNVASEVRKLDAAAASHPAIVAPSPGAGRAAPSPAPAQPATQRTSASSTSTAPPVQTSLPDPSPAARPAAVPPPVTQRAALQPVVRTQAAPQPQPAARAQLVQSTADSPLVAASRRTPSATVGANDSLARLAEAESLLQQGKSLAARAIYTRLAADDSLPRDSRLQVARGLNQVAAWLESSTAYAQVSPLQRGEEMHMFYEAVNRFELGDLRQARELLRRALPALPATREVAAYKARIDAAR